MPQILYLQLEINFNLKEKLQNLSIFITVL